MKYEYWFTSVKSIADWKKRELRKAVTSAEELYNIEEKEWEKVTCLKEKEIQALQESKRTWKLEKEFEELCKKRIEIHSFYSEHYPKRLQTIFDAPYAIFVKGKLPDEETLSAAIVGARRCTPYGEAYTSEFARSLAGCGIQIISGLAKGIDGIGQRGALLEGGKTFGVLGCGVDICYPREHIGLYADILAHEGGILSEHLPGTPPLPHHFPLRNRIISGLSDVVLVMEAKEKSGSLITADMALEQGKDIYALPGPVSSLFSSGCNRLIKQGAGILLSPMELLEDMSVLYRNSEQILHKNKIVLESAENMLYSCLGFYAKNLETLLEETKLSVPELMNLLLGLELKGLIKEVSKNNYIRVL